MNYSKKNRLLLAAGLGSVIFLLGSIINPLFQPLMLRQFSPAMIPVSNNENSPLFSMQFASHKTTPEVHSATALALSNNNIMAFWYGGTREGHQDVTIYQNTWHNQSNTWGQEKSIISRTLTRDNNARYIRKLGNPVVTRGSDGSIWLFYVSVSIGGWAGSAINLIRSYDEGQSWSAPKRLITSPFLNLSTLLKGTPVHYTDGTIGLPVYHEMIGKFGELIILDKAGDVIDKIRLSWGKTSLQPILFPVSANHAIAMMRYQGKAPKRLLVQSTSNAGLNWTAVKKSALPNPGSGIAGLVLNDNNNILHTHNQPSPLLLAFNNNPEERDDMSLAISIDNGVSWQESHTIEKNRLKVPDKNKQYSYPWLLQTQNGNIHLLYTWHKGHIRHIVFNTAWLAKIQHKENSK